MRTQKIAAWLRATGLTLGLLGLPVMPAMAAQQSFQTADAAVDAFVKAAKANDKVALAAILGPGSQSLLSSGDPVVDDRTRYSFLEKYDTKHALVPAGDNRMVLDIGPDDWPLPIPLVQSGGSWRFDSRQGAQEVVDRRIGRDEIAAIRTALTYVDAQADYFDRTKRGLGTGFYAQRLVSTPGHYDGLYWPTAEGEPESPLGALVKQAEGEGYPDDLVPGKPTPYQGYYYRILKAQGDNAEGGAKNYVVDGKMAGGFALIAWPVIYGASGITTFVVNQDGVVFQKDLGPNTARLAGAMTRFDPDIDWARVSVTEK
jgi:hypothetical protein